LLSTRRGYKIFIGDLLAWGRRVKGGVATGVGISSPDGEYANRRKKRSPIIGLGGILFLEQLNTDKRYWRRAILGVIDRRYSSIQT